MNIAKKAYEVNNYQILTDKGFIDIDFVIKTKSFKKYIVYFESGRYIECADRHAFIDINDEKITADELKIGDIIQSIDGCDFVFDVIETDEYENMYDVSLPYHHLYYANDILSHNSTTLANFAARQVLRGKNVALLSLEMAEDEFAKRFDSIYSLLDMNRMYLSDDYKTRLMRKLGTVKSREGRGELYIKQFPTGAASVNDFKIYLRELLMRGIKIDILYVDYINLMKSSLKKNDGNMYSTIKGIAEELRALSFEFEIPVVSVSQLNREGGFVGFEELSFNYIAESMGLPATADFMSIYGTNEDELIYESELHYKIVKNRLGGRVGDVDKFYFDSRNLKMYDSSEMDLWLSDASVSGDERNIAERQERQERNTGRGRRN